MLNLFKKKVKLYSPTDGTGVQIEEVADPVFAGKMLGDGFAVIPKSEYICAPCDGELMQVFPTNHAFGIVTEEGLEILVHIGIDTVDLKGEGFTRLKEQGISVKKGDPVVKVDLEALKAKEVITDTMVVITNMDKVAKIQSSIGEYVTGESVSEVVLA